MNIAFYAPLKPPTSPTPSGDRLIARTIMQALRAGGHDVELISEFRSYERHGNRAHQHQLKEQGQHEARRLSTHYKAMPPARRPQVMFTYHLYHKAPDWIGPEIARQLHIPYVVAEASHAPKQAGGAWADGHDESAKTIARADLVIGLNAQDKACVLPLLRAPSRYRSIAPFIDCALFDEARRSAAAFRQTLTQTHNLPGDAPLLFTAAMMRDGNKLDSFRLLSRALQNLAHRPWHLLIAGGGAAEEEVRQAFAPIANRVSWAGTLSGDDLRACYAAADLFLWPAIREVMGMSLLEAQAGGTPVIAGNAPGVLPLIDAPRTGLVVQEGNANAFSDAMDALLANHERRGVMGDAAAAYVRAHHDIDCAAAHLNKLLKEVLS